MAEEYFNRQDRFKALLIEAYYSQTLPFWFAFTSYIQWKEGKRKCDFKRTEMLGMRDIARLCVEMIDAKHPTAYDNIESFDRESLFYPFNGYEGDAANVAFLTQIEEELTNILILTSNG